MWTEKKHPSWWQLYVMLPVLVGLFWPEEKAALTETEHVIAELGILFLIFGFVQLWLRANRSALLYLDGEEGRWRSNRYEFPAAQLRDLDDHEDRAERLPMFQIPASEIKGVLSDTFEWDMSEDPSNVFADRRAVARKE